VTGAGRRRRGGQANRIPPALATLPGAGAGAARAGVAGSDITTILHVGPPRGLPACDGPFSETGLPERDVRLPPAAPPAALPASEPAAGMPHWQAAAC